MRSIALLISCLALTACAATGESERERQDTAVRDFVAVNELESVRSIRTFDPLSSTEVNDTFTLVSTKRENYLFQYYSRCIGRMDGRVEPDVRQDPRRIHARADTFRGCRIKAIYQLEPGQAQEVLNIGKSVGGEQ